MHHAANKPDIKDCLQRGLMVLSGLLFAISTGAQAAAENTQHASRVISLDYCADQYVLKLLPPARILAVSPDAGKVFSYMREAAAGIPRVRPRVEDVIIQMPDLVVRSYGGGPNARAFIERAGINVLQLGYADNLEDIMANITRVAAALGNVAGGRAIVADMRQRLDLARQSAQVTKVLYITPGGVTAGPGTLIDAMINAAGVSNFQTKPGWRTLPLERLAYEQPDMVVTAFFESQQSHTGSWSASRHPLITRQLETLPVVALDGAVTSCGGWFILDGVEAIADARRSQQRPQLSLSAIQ